jgi:signal transduction histidine kinase
VPLSLIIGSVQEAAWPLVLVAAFAMTVALGFARRTAPAALVIAWVTAVLQMAFGLPPIFADLAVFGVLFATGADERRAVRLAGLASSVVGPLVVASYLVMSAWQPWSQPSWWLPLFAAGLVSFVLAWTFGLLMWMTRRSQRERAETLAAQRETAAEQERLRIARDMHDVVAHSLTVIVAQADGARYASAAGSAQAGDALATISGTAREALGDVRVLLARLRQAQSDLPQLGVGELDGLLGQVREAGLTVEAVLGTPPDSVPAVVQLAVYRIVQESLTNALRHGDASQGSTLRLTWNDSEVRLEIRSRVRADTPAPSRGHGIAGMAERARLAGGTLVAERDRDEFVVRAALPIRERAS